MSNRPKRVSCLGVFVVDGLCGPIDAYPVAGRTTQVIAEFIRFQPGGGAANSSLALADLGVPVRVFAKVGDDLNAKFVLDYLHKRGVDISGVVLSAKEPTPFTFVGIHPGGDRTFVHTPGANKSFAVVDLDRRRLFDADILFYQDFWVLPQLDGTPAAELLAEARRRGIVTVLDECWGLGPDRAKLEAVLPHVDYLLPSYDDLAAIYPGVKPEDMIRLLRGKGTRRVILKLGPRGCLVGNADGITAVPSRADTVVDTTGAGDCFDAGFVAGLAHGLADVPAAQIGSLCAAACLRHVGGANGIPVYATLASQMEPPS
jgi:sugar/nucleoside kinase (ribokinase family)